MENDKFWIENPSILIEKFTQFLPTRNMTVYQQMNALTLLSIYSLLIIYLLGLSNNVSTILFISIIVILVILYYNKYNKKIINGDESFEIQSGYYNSDNALRLAKFYSEKNRNKDLDKMVYETSKKNQKILNKKREPTIDNPFMNPILNDFNTENVPYAVNIDDEVVQEKINLTFNKDLFKDMTDLFDSKNVERQFYTIPGGAIPNDQQKFAEWCYKTPYTCKEDTNNCINFDNMKFRNRYK